MAINPASLKPGDIVKVTLFKPTAYFYMVYADDNELNWLLLSTPEDSIPRCLAPKSSWIQDTSEHSGTEVVGNMAKQLTQLQEDLRELHK